MLWGDLAGNFHADLNKLRGNSGFFHTLPYFSLVVASLLQFLAYLTPCQHSMKGLCFSQKGNDLKVIFSAEGKIIMSDFDTPFRHFFVNLSWMK